MGLKRMGKVFDGRIGLTSAGQNLQGAWVFEKFVNST